MRSSDLIQKGHRRSLRRGELRRHYWMLFSLSENVRLEQYLEVGQQAEMVDAPIHHDKQTHRRALDVAASAAMSDEADRCPAAGRYRGFQDPACRDGVGCTVCWNVRRSRFI